MFRRLGIRSRLLTLLAIPTVALVALSGVGVVRATRTADASAQVTQLMAQVSRTADLVGDLQNERQRSVVYISSGRQAGESAVAAARRLTDRNLTALSATAVSDPGSGTSFHEAMDQATGVLEGLDAHRAKILGSEQTGLTAGQARTYYDRAIEELIVVGGELRETTGDEVLRERVLNLTILARVKELVARERMLMGAVFTRDELTDDRRAEIAANVEAQASYRDLYAATVPADSTALYDEVVGGSEVDTVATWRRLAIGLHKVDSPTIGFDPTEYDQAMNFKLRRLDVVEAELSERLVDAAAELQAEAEREQLAFLGVAVVAVLLALVLALITSRSLVRPLRQLDASARDLRERLPKVVARLQHADATPDPDDMIEPTRVSSPPELARLGGALDDVGTVAVEVATEQARLRASISEMFTNFARRNQRLLDRQLSLIDALESDEADPDRLAELFTLDHLSTRMRRNAESLLVLAGTEPTRAGSAPIELADVVRAAVSEIEDYERVTVNVGHQERVVGHAASSLAHLLAELLDNAAAFSPPSSHVYLDVAASPDGVTQLVVRDSGIGMTPEEISAANERIADPPLIDAAVSKLLGFFVVGRLARRLGVKVQLEPGEPRGLRVVVELAEHLLVTDSQNDEADGSRPVGLTASELPAVPSGPVRRTGPVERTASGLARRGQPTQATEAPADQPEEPVTTGADVAQPAATTGEQPSRLVDFASGRLRAERTVRAEGQDVTAEPLRTLSPIDEAAEWRSRPQEPAETPAEAAPVAATDGGTAQATGAGLTRRTPRAKPAPLPPPAVARPAAPISPDTVANTLASLQSGWRQAENALSDTPAQTHSTESVVGGDHRADGSTTADPNETTDVTDVIGVAPVETSNGSAALWSSRSRRGAKSTPSSWSTPWPAEKDRR